MGFHTFDPESADRLEDESRHRYCSREELVGALALDSGREGSVADSDSGPTASVADLGSGTGFYTDDVAPFADKVKAVDVQDEMHELYREKGVPENVELVTADIGTLPFGDGKLDAAFSTMTFHEFAGSGDGGDAEESDGTVGSEDLAGAEREVARVLRDGGRFVVADWTANGDGESGPPVAERYDREEAVELLENAGFDVPRADERPETFLLVAEN
jgi:SAM-dependent methyltransferase